MKREKLYRCSECGKWVVGSPICPVCEGNMIKNDDPYEVTPLNLMKMVMEFENCDDDFEAWNVYAEIEFASNQAYMRGYISQFLYISISKKVGFTPKFDEWMHIDKRLYCDSIEARLGWVYELFSEEE